MYYFARIRLSLPNTEKFVENGASEFVQPTLISIEKLQMTNHF
jgi:hypothetical protein